jgi:phosphatidylethanolamine/phosphatidyl-N-methylethanolamine N-methyltransferase
MRMPPVKEIQYQRLLKRFLPLPIHNVGSGVASLFVFGREILDSPRSMGAICPSSPKLARRMASLVDHRNGIVVELGGGTGAVTAALLEHGVIPQNLIVVEQSAKLSALLKNRFPEITVINGDAASLAELLGPDCGRVRAIVSSLPLRSLECSVVRNILEQLEQVLQEDGLFIQYAYSHRDQQAKLSQHFNNIHSSIVWGNLPPARIDAYRFVPKSVND